MMRNKRKRKVAVAPNEEKENERQTAPVPAYNNGPMYKIMSQVQTSEALHKKYVKEMQQLYTKMTHDAFIVTFIRMIKSAMECDETNEYALCSLQFCAKYIVSYDDEETHPVIISIFNWISQTSSNNPHIRFRLCQFVNLILSALGIEAALDDAICDKILEYMVERLRDMSPSVRVQSIVAMQRLQVPDNPNDPVLRSYQFHLCSDPSPRVRQAVITCMGRNYITIPYILDRLWDIDEKVRRHTYLHMSSYPVRSYKVSQRLMLLEQGLNDRAEVVRKVVTKVMLRQWLESYQGNIVAFISALKLDANEEEIERFRKVAKQTLLEIFKSEERQKLIDLLPLDYESEFHRCVPHENLTLEIVIYWQCLSDSFQAQGADELDLILPELSVFCAYVKNFCAQQKPDIDKFQRMEFQYKLIALLEILSKYDLGDEIGRGNFQNLVSHLLKNASLDDKNVEIIVRCAENLLSDQNTRMQFLIEIVQDLCQLNKEHNNLWNDRTVINEALANCADPALNLKLSELKVKILDLEEQEMVLLQNKNYVKAQEITEEKNNATEEYTTLLKPLLSAPLELRKVNNENILTALQIIFYMVVSDKVRSLSPEVCKLYNDFICRHVASSTITIRDWALKCGTAYAMHYEPIAKDLFNELYSQFFKHHNARIWETSVKCIFEIMDMYGVDSFAPIEQQSSNSKRTGRVLYNTLGSLDTDDEIQVSVDGQGVGVIYMMTHFLDTCDNVAIVSEIILGFIKLIVHGFIDSSDIIEKLLLRYFNPSTDNKIKQYLSLFLEEMIGKRKQNMLVPSLLPTLSAVFSAPYDSPLLDIRPETITRFFIDVTRQDACPQRNNNIHNKLAHSFLTEMLSNCNNKDLCKLLAKEILKLEIDVGRNSALKQEMIEMSQKLLASEFDSNIKKNISNFEGILNGTFNPPARNENESEDDNDEDTTNRRSTITPTAATIQIEQATENNPSSTAELNDEGESTLTPSQSQVAANVSVPQEENTQTNTEITEASNNNNVQSADGAIEKIPSSQCPATIATATATATTESQAQSSIVTPPPVTTFGRQNTVGQICLRRSLNSSSRLQSESEISDTVTNTPKIRIELRIDSEKKKEKTPEPQTNYKEKDISKKKTPKAITPASGRTLRQLRTRRRAFSPTPIIVCDSDQNSNSEEEEEVEANTSDVVPESPQASRETTRLHLPTRRPRRVAQADKQAPVTEPRVSRKTKQTRQERENQPRSSPRQTSQQTTPTKRLPRKLLYSNNVLPLTVNTLKRSYPTTPYPKKKKTTSETSVNQSSSSSSSSSLSSVSRSPRAKQARRSIFSTKSSQQKKSTSENNSDSNEKSSSTDDKTPLKKRSRFNKILPYSTTKLVAKSQNDNETNRRKSASNIPTNAIETATNSTEVNCNSTTKMSLRKRGYPLKTKKANVTPNRRIEKASEENTLRRTATPSVSNLSVQIEAAPKETINVRTEKTPSKKTTTNREGTKSTKKDSGPSNVLVDDILSKARSSSVPEKEYRLKTLTTRTKALTQSIQPSKIPVRNSTTSKSRGRAQERSEISSSPQRKRTNKQAIASNVDRRTRSMERSKPTRIPRKITSAER